MFFFSSRRRHTRWTGDWSSDVCSSDLSEQVQQRRLSFANRSYPARPSKCTSELPPACCPGRRYHLVQGQRRGWLPTTQGVASRRLQGTMEAVPPAVPSSWFTLLSARVSIICRYRFGFGPCNGTSTIRPALKSASTSSSR